MTVSNTTPVPETTPIYIGTDGGGPGIQWKKTRSGWRVSESDDQEPESPSRTSVQNLLERHIKKTSNAILMVNAEGINGAPPTRSGASEGLSYLPVVTKTTQTESGYTTLGEAIRRLDLVEAISDPEKANFVFRVLEMTVQHKLLSLSGSAIRRLFCIISKFIQVMEDSSNFAKRERLNSILTQFKQKLTKFMKELSCSHSAVELCINKCDALKARLGSIKVKENHPELNLVDLPTEIQDKIMMNMNCLKDLESMSEATPFLTQIAAEYEKVHLVKLIETNWDEEACRDWRLPKWKKNAPSSDSENLDLPTMRLQYNRLAKKHGLRETYPIQLQYCKKTCVLYWEDATNPLAIERVRISDSDLMTVSPDSFVMTFFEPNTM